MWNGAHLTVGGVWTNASSRELKDNIETLSSEDANKTLAGLSPVRYVYKNSPDEEYVGFIAEDVPDLVASNDRKSLSPMDIVAVLTTVTKEQAAKMTEKDAEIAALKAELQTQRVKQDERMLQMEMALAELLRNQSSENQVGLAYLIPSIGMRNPGKSGVFNVRSEVSCDIRALRPVIITSQESLTFIPGLPARGKEITIQPDALDEPDARSVPTRPCEA